MNRLLTRVGRQSSAAAVAAVAGLPLASVLLSPAAHWTFKLLLVALTTTAALRPAAGALGLVLAVPLALGVGIVAHVTSSAATEAMTLAFVAGGALGACAVAHGSFGRLARPAAVFAAVVVTSAIVDLAAIRAITPNRPFFADLWHHVVSDYWGEDRGNWVALHDAVRWVGVLATAVFIDRAVRASDRLRRPIVWAWLLASAGAAILTVLRIVEILSRQTTPVWQSVLWLLRNHRLSVLYPDFNAAGSAFGLLLVAVLVIAIRRRSWLMLLVPFPLLLVGFIVAQSRSAVGVVLLVLVARWSIARIRRRSWVPVALLAVGVVAAAGSWMVMSRAHASPLTALEIRRDLTRVGLRMAARDPVFGVGLSDYIRTSRRFITKDMTALVKFAPQGENAHNNFLQILVELGIPALAAFVWLTIPVVWAAWRHHAPGEAEYQGLALGLTAFMITALLGHPLLIPEVAMIFFIALGLASGHRPETHVARDRGLLVARLGVAFFVVSLLWRLT